MKSKKSFSTVLFTHTSGYLRYLRRKQTVTDLPTPPDNVATLACEMQYVFIWLRFVAFLPVFLCWYSFFRWIKIYIKPLDRSNAFWAGQMYRLIQIPKLFRLWKNKLTYSDSILAAVYNGANGQTERATNLNICTSRQHWQMSGTPLAHGITIGPLTNYGVLGVRG